MNWLISQMEKERSVLVSEGEKVARRTALCCASERAFIV